MAMSDIRRRLWDAGTMLCAAALLGAILSPRPGFAETAAPPHGAARIWIYRIDDPSITLQTPNVRINGAVVAIAQLGTAFYRDVPPGNYLITADSSGSAPDQFARVALAAGQTVFVKVDANNWWASANCETAVVTFYTLVVYPPLARAEMASLTVAGG
jgi:hypothetical protein